MNKQFSVDNNRWNNDKYRYMDGRRKRETWQGVETRSLPPRFTHLCWYRMNPFHTQGVYKGRSDVAGRLSSMLRRRDAILIATWSWPKYPPRPPGYRVLVCIQSLSIEPLFIFLQPKYFYHIGSRDQLITSTLNYVYVPWNKVAVFPKQTILVFFQPQIQ